MAANYVNSLGIVLAQTVKHSKGYAGTAGRDTMLGTSANEGFRGYSGPDTYIGGGGDDTYFVSNLKDVVIEKAGEGIDTVQAEQNHILAANVENLILTSATGWYGEGNALDNILIAKVDRQTLNGGAGNDVLVSEAKYSTFVVARGNGSDVIYGFDKTDTIRLDNYGFTSFAAVQKIASQVGADTLLSFNNGERLILRDTAVTSLTAGNFLVEQDRSALKTTFSDEFDALSLSTKGGTWRTEYGHGGVGSLASRTLNDEIQLYMDPDFKGTGKTALGIDPFKIDKGVLTITASQTPEAAKQYLGNAEYTSGLLTTKFSFAQAYGYFEIKAKLPENKGFWPAFWLMPTDNSWPPELDVFEQLSKDPSTLYMSNHGIDANGKKVTTSSLIHVDTTQWHTYGADWGPEKITYYIDGIAVATQDTPAAMKGKDMYMLVNLAVGGAWGGAPDAAASAQMQVDYVRAYATQNTTSVTTNGVKTAYTPDTVTTDPTPVVVASAEPVVLPPVIVPPVVVPPVVTPPEVVKPQIVGTAGNDTLVATANDSELRGNAGDDILRAGSFSATMVGGTGNDTYYVTAANQVLKENAGEGIDNVRASISYILTDNIETLVLEGTGNIDGTGNALDNRIIGNAGNNVLIGGAGNDMLDGGATGKDTLIGGTGDDTYYVRNTATTLVEKAGEGTDSVRSTISWTLGDNFETLVLEGTANINAVGNSADNRLFGNSGDNVIAGGAGNDTLDGGSGGKDTLIGGTGDDVYYVTRTSMTLTEKAGEGNDTVRSTITWTLGDNFETLVLDGAASVNATGNALANRIVGNAGNNVITGGGGNDQLTGGAGNDTFVFARGFGNDVVTDFNAATDTLQFQGYARGSMHLTQVGANVVIDFGGADSITLLGVKATDPNLAAHLLF